MLYCKKCMALEDRCGCKSKKLREAEDNDTVFLMEQNYLVSSQIENILSENDVPFIKKSRMGAALAVRTGMMLESYRFFVPYSYLEKAKDLVGFFEE